MIGADAVCAAIGVGIRRVKNAGEQRAEAFALHSAARGERERAHGAAVKRAVKRNQLVALRMKLGQLDGCFDGFRAGISEINALGGFSWGDGREALRQFDQRRIIKIRAGHVNQFGGLLLNCGDDIGMAMARCDDSNARGEI